jgi:hypothetical protein
MGRREGWGGEKFGETSFRGLEACKPLKSQNRQSFLWKSLQKKSLNLEKLGKVQGGPPLFRHLTLAGAPVSRGVAA